MYLSKQKCSKRCLLLFPFTGSILHFSSNRIVWTLDILLLFQIRISCTVQYLVYENSLIVYWKSICKVKLVLLQEVKEPVLRRIGGARGGGGANLKKKNSFSSFCCDTKKISYLCKIFRRKNFYGKQDTELSWVTKQFFR